MWSVIHTQKYRLRPGEPVRLRERPTREHGGLDKRRAKKGDLPRLRAELLDLNNRLYAEGHRAVLVVLQAMDAAGKDSTIRRCFGRLNPQRCGTVPFRPPSEKALAHDFLWRAHREVPSRGTIGIFNRSHYEDVLAVRVQGLADEATWQRRYEHINAFERLLNDEGTRVLKFFLHISPDYQKKRFERRLHRADKQWKFAPEDLDNRERWEAYMDAYEDALRLCSTEDAPWYVVPAERRWFRDLVIVQTVVEHLEAMAPTFPEPDFDLEAAQRRAGRL